MKRIDLTDEQIALAHALWVDGRTRDEIAAAIGVTIDTFRARCGDQLRGLPERSRSINNNRRGEDPTPEQIAHETALLRASWPDERFLPEKAAEPTAFRTTAF